jgi:hypothetical protein
MESIMSWFRDMPETRAAKYQQPSLLNQRKEWAEQVRKAEEEHQKVSRVLWAAEAEARDEVERTEQRAAEMIRKSKQAFFEKQHERQKADEKRHRELMPALGNLRRTASPKIYQFSKMLEDRRRTIARSDIG